MPTFYGVFGQEHFHPATGQNLRYHYVEIEAPDEDSAQAVMRETFGRGWRHLKTSKPVGVAADPKAVAWVQAAKVSFMAASEAAYVRLPMPSTERVRPGETVTLRVRLTDEMAKESALFIAGRCIAHRPGPNHPVEHGAGVWFEDNQRPEAWDEVRTFSLEGAGSVVLVRYVPKTAAEEAMATDPENVSIMPGTGFQAWLGIEPDSTHWAREHSGCLSSDMAWAMPGEGAASEELVEQARHCEARVAELKSWRDRLVGFEVEGGHVIGVRMASR